MSSFIKVALHRGPHKYPTRKSCHSICYRERGGGRERGHFLAARSQDPVSLTVLGLPSHPSLGSRCLCKRRSSSRAPHLLGLRPVVTVGHPSTNYLIPSAIEVERSFPSSQGSLGPGWVKREARQQSHHCCVQLQGLTITKIFLKKLIRNQ